MAALISLLPPLGRSLWRAVRRGGMVLLAWLLFAVSFSGLAAERHSDPDGCFSCHGLPGLEHIDKNGVLRTATILRKDYYGSLHGSVSCKDCHRQIDKYPHKPEEGYVDCSESCHVNEPSKGKPFTHKDVVDEYKQSAHGSGHAPGPTKDFHGGNRLSEETDQQNPSCRRCHSNTPYINPNNMGKFQEAFHHTDTECGTCHPGETWRNQYSGHILRRLVGNNFNKMEANAMCVDCHADYKLMEKAKLEDPLTKEKKAPTYRWVHATDSYDKTLHGRYLAVNDESGPSCIDCHAPKGFRHGVQRDELISSPTHPAHLAETCSQAGCHGYARSVGDLGFVKTDVHDTDMLKFNALSMALDFSNLDSNWYKTAWVVAPLSLVFLVSSVLHPLSRSRKSGAGAVLGQDSFNTVMLGAKPKVDGSWLARIMARLGREPAARAPVAATEAALGDAEFAATPKMTILYGSQTGNGEGLAQDLGTLAEAKGYACEVFSMDDYEPSHLLDERFLIVIVSTHGEGDPPIPAERLHAYLYSESAPRLPHIRFAVFALGDSSYRHFCKAGKDFDAFLLRLGATKVLPRVDADVDFEETASEWMQSVLDQYFVMFGAAGIVGPVSNVTLDFSVHKAGEFGKSNPYPAAVLTNRNLNGPGSAKQTHHLEIDLGDSGLSYEPGDVLGVYPKNDPRMVEALLERLKLDGWREVTLGKESLSLREALFSRLDITTLSRPLLEKYAALTGGTSLAELLADPDPQRLESYGHGRDLLDLVSDYPPPPGLTEQGFAAILRRIPARLYSIASSIKAHPRQVHLTVGAVRYQAHGRAREGVCSTYLTDRLASGQPLGIFVQINKHFRLPEKPTTPVIMVGPGTGIAPFRAFVEEREATGATGRNWLFFGDQHEATDYLYAQEWRDKLGRGVLTRLDLAFSRDQDKKVYVQDRMLESADELFAWLQDGAHFYVCGDASRMAADVDQALHTIVARAGGMDADKAAAYVARLVEAKRYQRDVY